MRKKNKIVGPCIVFSSVTKFYLPYRVVNAFKHLTLKIYIKRRCRRGKKLISLKRI